MRAHMHTRGAFQKPVTRRRGTNNRERVPEDRLGPPDTEEEEADHRTVRLRRSSESV